MSKLRKQLLESLSVDPPEKLGEFFGVVMWVKAPTELTRSRRASSLYDSATGKVSRDAIAKSRVYSIIDSVCDENGDLLFTDADFDELASLDSIKIDSLDNAISAWLEGKEKNVTAA